VKIEIVAVDRLRSSWVRTGVAEYLERIARYAPVERRDVKTARGDDRRAIDEEGRRLLTAVSKGSRDRLVPLTPTGELLDSESWARMLADWAADGATRVVFLVGGAGGLAEPVLEAADRRISLGPQTMSHELTQLVLVEQIYRAWTILRGEPYHK
jgi:23S rRNA (pseudouridine1915-N3)-methyltransferase